MGDRREVSSLLFNRENLASYFYLIPMGTPELDAMLVRSSHWYPLVECVSLIELLPLKTGTSAMTIPVKSIVSVMLVY